MPDPVWYDASTAQTALNIVVTDAGLLAARQECLRIKGQPLDLAAPPTEAFAQGVVYQALANKQATMVGQSDTYGDGDAPAVQLRPFDGKIMGLLIIPSPVTDEDGTVTGDAGRVRGMVG